MTRVLFSVCVGALFLVPSSYAKEREVTVTGSCSRHVTTDRGAVVVTADALESDLKSAVKKATRAYDRAVDAIKKLNLENLDLQTVEYSVAEVKEWENNRSVSKGFRARIGLKVSTSEVQRLGEVTEIASKEELREVGDLTTYLSPERIRKEQDLCLKEAAENAHDKAEKLATTLGARVGEVVTLTESNVSTPQPVPLLQRGMLRAAVPDGEAQAPPIENGKQEVSATIQASFALK